MAISKQKEKVTYVCNSCGSESLRWAGRCSECSQWGTLEEVVRKDPGPRGGGKDAKPAGAKKLLSISQKSSSGRLSMGMDEFDRVLGGGLVRGEIVLLAGEPGIGKSTLLMQVALKLAEKYSVLYVSGEESLEQLASRADRLQTKNIQGGKKVKRAGNKKPSVNKAGTANKSGITDNLSVTDDTDVHAIISLINQQKPDLVIVDSVQSLSVPGVGSYPGSITQVRESGALLTQCAKSLGTPILLVGQVTKEGVMAGPKILEHVVDAVVYFEGDEMGVYRILKSVKNRFGTTDEVGIFEMTALGLIEVDDPSDVFGSQGRLGTGSAISAVYKGSRTLFVEIQALTASSMFGSPRRLPTGLSKPRLEMLCAVLTRRAGVNLSEDDVFVNVLGGMKVDDPSVDLAVCLAVASAKLDKPLRRTQVFVGEVGLSGDIRSIPFLSKMVSEAKRRKLSIVGPTGTRRKDIRSIVKQLFI